MADWSHSKIRLFVTGAERKFIVIVRKNRTFEEALRRIQKAHLVCFGEEIEIERLEFEGYACPNEYKVGELLEDRSKVTAVAMRYEAAPVKRQKEAEPEITQVVPPAPPVNQVSLAPEPIVEKPVQAEPLKKKEVHFEAPQVKEVPKEVPKTLSKKEKEAPKPEQQKVGVKTFFSQEDSEDSESESESLAMSHTPKRNLFRT